MFGPGDTGRVEEAGTEADGDRQSRRVPSDLRLGVTERRFALRQARRVVGDEQQERLGALAVAGAQIQPDERLLQCGGGLDAGLVCAVERDDVGRCLGRAR